MTNALPFVGALCAAALVGGAVALVRLRRALAAASRRAESLAERLEGHRAESAATEALLRTLLETAPAAMVLFDERGQITFTNAAARELFFQGAAVEGQNFLSMLERAPEPLRRALLAEADELFTVAVGAEPETFHLSTRSFSAAGETLTLVMVKHMTQEIARQEIATLRKVIRIICHELNNSLGPISSLAGSGRLLLQRSDQLPKLERILETVEERSRHLGAFLEGYARLAKLPAPKAAVVPWERFLSGLRGLWPQVRIERAPEGAGFFDPAQIEQVLINLLKNAREAGGPEEEIAIEIERAGDGGVWIAVLDRGAGIADEVKDDVLLPFFTTKPNGSGLGLALCREIVERHRGRLRLARRDGGGTIVSFWLPDRERPLSAALAASRARLTLSAP